jgi:hypothetical protein
MKSSQPFLNSIGRNIDGFDASIRDALEPWPDALASAHQRVDEILAIEHGDGA